MSLGLLAAEGGLWFLYLTLSLRLRKEDFLSSFYWNNLRDAPLLKKGGFNSLIYIKVNQSAISLLSAVFCKRGGFNTSTYAAVKSHSSLFLAVPWCCFVFYYSRESTSVYNITSFGYSSITAGVLISPVDDIASLNGSLRFEFFFLLTWTTSV